MTPPLYARLVLPPALAWNGERYCGARLQRIDTTRALGQSGVQQVVVLKQLVAVIATSDSAARAARPLVRCTWSAGSDNRANDARLPRVALPRRLFGRGATGPDADADAADTLASSYRWQPGMPDGAPGAVTVQATPVPEGMQIDLPFAAGAVARELADLLRVAPGRIAVQAVRAAQSDGEARAAIDAAGVAALLCLELGCAVSLTLEAGATTPRTTLLHAGARVDNNGLHHYRLDVDQPAAAPPLAWLLTGRAHDLGDVSHTPAETLAPPYDWPAVEVRRIGTGDDIAPAAVTFAQESFVDELANQAGQDPVAYRLAHVDDPRGARLIRSVAQAAHWQARTTGEVASRAGTSGVLRGRGFGYATTIEHEADQPVQSWSAWVADVEYDPASGELSVTRAIAGHDLQGMPALDGAQAALGAGAPDTQARLAVSHLITPGTGFDDWASGSPGPATQIVVRPITSAVDVIGPPAGLQSKDVQLKAGGAFALPAAAAVANAIHDATGVRLRSAPFSGAQVKQALTAQQTPTAWRRLKTAGWIGGALAAIGTTLTLAMPWRAAIAPVAPPSPDLYSTATIERGRLVALAGDCVVCHTAPGGGVPNAGGHALDTPFGTIYTTNITPDEKTGIGNWSFAAFERAMREGIHRDGRNLYPAFPYTAYAKMTDADMQSLYAYLMVQKPVEQHVPASSLRFPFNMRPLLAGWNALFHKPEVFQPDPDRSTLWNRGAYLVEGAGHCSACHSPRNAMGAEKKGLHHLSGGVVDGWEAPSLTGNSKAPTAWTEDELFTYLRTGFSARHGIAAGPMAPVVAELAQLPSDDVRAMAHYLASLNDKAGAAIAPEPAAPLAMPPAAAVNPLQTVGMANGKRLFHGACAACHMENSGPTLFGVRPSLKVNTSVHSDKPDNLIHVILNGIQQPANADLGYMPGFADSMSDKQVADLLVYVRSTFAGDKPAWSNLEEDVASARLRTAH